MVLYLVLERDQDQDVDDEDSDIIDDVTGDIEGSQGKVLIDHFSPTKL